VYKNGSAAHVRSCPVRRLTVLPQPVGCPDTSPAAPLLAAPSAVPTPLSAILHRDPVIGAEKPPCKSFQARHANLRALWCYLSAPDN